MASDDATVSITTRGASVESSSAPRKSRARRTPAKTAKASPAAQDRDELQNRLVVVLGMHRSGSSAIAKGLQTLGVDLGDNLMPPAQDNNNKGFFEDLDIYRLNEALLRKAQSAWHRLAPIDPQLLTGPTYSSERRTAAALLARKRASASVFGFKDPRTAVLLPFWQCVFADADLDVRYVITLRNPLDTAASLEARDKFPLTKSLMLWAKHVLQAVTMTDGLQRTFVSYDALINDPLAELKRMAAFLELPAPLPNSDAVKEFCRDFLTEDLRHNKFGRQELGRSGAAPHLVMEVEKAIHGLAQNQDQQRARLAALRVEFERLSPLLALMDTWEAHRGEATRRAEGAETRLAEANEALAASQAEREKLAVANDAEARELAERAATAEAALAQSNDALAAEQARNQALAEKSDAATKQTEQDIAALNAQKAALAGANEELGKRAAAAEAALAELLPALAREQAQSAALASTNEALAGQLANTENLLSELSQALTHQQVQASALAAANETLARQVEGSETVLQQMADRLAQAEQGSLQVEERLRVIATERNALEQQLGEVRGSLARALAEVETQSSALEQATADLVLERLSHEAALEEMKALRQELDALFLEKSGYEAALAVEAQELQNARARIRHHEIALADAEERALAGARAIETATTALDEAMARAAESSQRAETAEMMSASARGQLAVLEQDVEQAKAHALTIEAEIASVRAEQVASFALLSEELAAARQAHHEAQAEAVRQQGALQSELGRVGQELARAIASATEAETRAAQVTAKVRDLQSERDESREQLEGLRQALQECETAGRRMTTDLAALRSYANDTSLRLSAAAADASRVKQELEAASTDLAQMRTLVSQRESEIENLRRVKQELEEALRNQRRDLLLARASIAEFQQSTSWRLTAPLRKAATTLRNPSKGLRDLMRGKAKRPAALDEQ